MKAWTTSKGDFSKSIDFLKKANGSLENALNKAGEEGVAALEKAIPKDSGLASQSWRYELEKNGNGHYGIVFHNDDIEGGYNVAILVQYGHGLRNGGYVQGRDYINPALRPIFDNLANDVWEELNR